MTKILFVCHGSICRSPMAEFIFGDLVKKANLEASFLIESAAVSRDFLRVSPGKADYKGGLCRL